MTPFLVRHLIFPLAERAAHRLTMRHWDFLVERERVSRKEIADEQRKRLFQIVRFAGREIPYYRALFRKEGLRFTEEGIIEEMRDIPPLPRDRLRDRFDDLRNPDRSEPFRVERTGGSSGEPVRLLQSRETVSWNQANRWYFHGLAGHRLGEKLVQIWGSERDLVTTRERPRRRLYRRALNMVMLGCFRMSEEQTIRIVERIDRERPKAILGYVECLETIADYLLRDARTIHRPATVLCASNTLFPEVRDKIEAAFRAPAHNLYGSRDAGPIAVECEERSGLHYNPFSHYIEIVDENGDRLPPGEPGEILVTILMNRVMPLIRYRIGDRGALASEPCPCGRTPPRLAAVEGRVTDVFTTRDGATVSPGFFIHLMGVVHGKGMIRRFQVIQETIDRVTVRFVPSRPGVLEKEADTFRKIREEIVHVMGEGTAVRFEETGEIEPTRSGKYRSTISKVSGRERRPE